MKRSNVLVFFLSGSLAACGAGAPTEMGSQGEVSTDDDHGVTSDDGGTSTGGTDDETGGVMPIFDVGPDETGGEPGECCGEAPFSYIWIANSGESTVSKVNTRTMVEEGRYLTKGSPGNPSRTSVSVDGRAVAVANRFGGVVKIWARPEDCAGPNTSTGPDDVKAWGTDDCVAWYTDFPQAKSQRPIAWTTGVLDEETCEWEDQKIWTAEGSGPNPGEAGACNDDNVRVHRLDGTTGEIEESIELPYACTNFGIYGGVVDANNDVWLTRLFESGPGAIRVDYETLEYQEAAAFRGYGIAVDHKGKIWGGTGNPGKWDPDDSSWTTIVETIDNVGVGLAEDQANRMWVGIFGGIQAVETDTLALGPTVMFEGEDLDCKGISVDVDGYIWAVPDKGDRAYRVDPDDLSYEMIDGFDTAYTYSDMTGGSLNNVACNPPEG